MNLRTFVAALLIGATAMLGMRALADDRPITEHWFPSEWGPNDRIGALNRINPCTVMAAVKVVKKGKTSTLGKTYSPTIPFFGQRSWRIVLPGKPTGGPFGEHNLVYNDEFIATEIGQVGTQFDGPGHIGVRTSKGDMYYNGVMLQDDGDQYMLDKLGVHQVADQAIVCRAILLNGPAYKGLKRLPIPKGGDHNDPGNVNDDDIKGMLKKEGLTPHEGDCIFLYTGHGDIWDDAHWDSFTPEERAKRIAMTNAGEPGFGSSGCRYLISLKPAFYGGDAWANDAVPQEIASQPFECHIEMQMHHGIWNIENLDFGELLADDTYEFMFAWSPLKMRGATGSPGNPIAIW